MDPVTGGVGGCSYPDSASSSPLSRSADSYDDAFPSNNSNNTKVRLMCSYGGRIVPRPTDKSLTYLGGDTRFVLLDRHSSLADLLSKLTKTVLSNSPNGGSESFVIKYQLPNEDLDSLITLSSDEDLDNMIDEYDRINNSSSSAARTPRIRLFLFPTGKATADTSSSIGSLLDDSKSETWFVDALNGALGAAAAGSADLLGLEVGGGDRTDAGRGMTRPDSYGKLETGSSFGSGSSGPVPSNLPPFRVQAEDRPPGRRCENDSNNLEDQFQKMNLLASSGAKNLTPVTTAANTAVSSVENLKPNLNSNSNRIVGSSDERPDSCKQQQMVNQQQKPPLVESPVANPRPVSYQERVPPVQANPEPKRDVPASDQATAYRMQQVPPSGMQQVPVPGMQQAPVSGMQQIPGSVPPPESGYAMQTIPAPQQSSQPQQQQQQQQQQQRQFVHASPQYVPVQSYYQVPHPIQQSPPYDPSIPMYYVPQMIHVAARGTEQGYHVMHHHRLSQTPSPAQPMANYVYYTQTTTMTPEMPAQYQTVISDAAQPTVDGKQNRAFER